MQNNKFVFESREKILDTTKIANKSKNIMKEAIKTLEVTEIPSDFECSNRIKESINLLESIIHNIDVTNKKLFIKVEEVLDVRNRYRRQNLPSLYMTRCQYSGSYGLSYKELDNMKYNDLIGFLGKKALNAPILKTLENALDKENAEIQERFRTNNMFFYKYRIVNSYTDESSVCQGAAYLDDNTIVYCDVDTEARKGYLRVMRKNEKYDKTRGVYDRTAIELSHIEIEGHSNDITYIPEDGAILHIDDKNNEIDVYKIDKDYNITKSKKIDNIKANGIAYDKERKEVVIVKGTNVNRYTKNNLMNRKTTPKPKEKFKIPDKIKNIENSTYYNYIQGIAANDGILYVSYSGFKTDKEKYFWDNGEEDRPIGNRIVLYDYENGGEAIGSIVDNVGVEIESIDFNEINNLIAFYNGGHWTRVFETDLINSKTIAKDYKASKNEINNIEVAKYESNRKDK